MKTESDAYLTLAALLSPQNLARFRKDLVFLSFILLFGLNQNVFI